MKKSSDDTRFLGGQMIGGSGDPMDAEQNVMFDTTNAVHLEDLSVARAHSRSNDEHYIALEVTGRINRTTERTTVMYFGDVDMAAAIITELHGLCERAGWTEQLEKLLKERWAKMPHPER